MSFEDVEITGVSVLRVCCIWLLTGFGVVGDGSGSAGEIQTPVRVTIEEIRVLVSSTGSSSNRDGVGRTIGGSLVGLPSAISDVR